MTMFHPYYGSQDFDIERYEMHFSDCGTDWKAIHKKISPLFIRMEFIKEMLDSLESMDFS